MQLISLGNFYLGKDKESFVKLDIHFGTFRLEYERPRLDNDGAKPPQESD